MKVLHNLIFFSIYFISLIIVMTVYSINKKNFSSAISAKTFPSIEKMDAKIKEDCRQKNTRPPGKYTSECKILSNFSPIGKEWQDDCGDLIWAYSTIECSGYKYFGWQTWNNSIDKKNVWIDGKQYYRSCQWPNHIPDSELKPIDCNYNFLKKGK